MICILLIFPSLIFQMALVNKNKTVAWLIIILIQCLVLFLFIHFIEANLKTLCHSFVSASQ